MSNMSYCRFENTSIDMDDCLDALENGKAEDLSDYEKEGLQSMLKISKSIVGLEDEINQLIK